MYHDTIPNPFSKPPHNLIGSPASREFKFNRSFYSTTSGEKSPKNPKGMDMGGGYHFLWCPSVLDDFLNRKMTLNTLTTVRTRPKPKPHSADFRVLGGRRGLLVIIGGSSGSWPDPGKVKCFLGAAPDTVGEGADCERMLPSRLTDLPLALD